MPWESLPPRGLSALVPLSSPSHPGCRVHPQCQGGTGHFPLQGQDERRCGRQSQLGSVIPCPGAVTPTLPGSGWSGGFCPRSYRDDAPQTSCVTSWELQAQEPGLSRGEAVTQGLPPPTALCLWGPYSQPKGCSETRSQETPAQGCPGPHAGGFERGPESNPGRPPPEETSAELRGHCHLGPRARTPTTDM